MKATGMTRRIDELGRVVIPKEIRRTYNLNVGDELEIYTEADGVLVMRKHSRMLVVSDIVSGVAEAVWRTTGGTILVTDSERVIATSGMYRMVYEDAGRSQEVHDVLSRRRGMVLRGDMRIPIADESESVTAEVMYVVPIMSGGDIYGSIIALVDDADVDIVTTVVDTAASFLALNIGK